MSLNKMYKKEEFYVKLKDGYLSGMDYETSLEDAGCPTCGYGESWATDITVYFQGKKEDNALYISPAEISVGSLIMVFCRNIEKFKSMTHDECFAFLKEELEGGN